MLSYKKLTKHGYLAAVSALLLSAAAYPSFALGAAKNPESGSVTQILSESSFPAADNSFAASLFSGTDPLAGLDKSSGTLVGDRTLLLRDDAIKLRNSVNLHSNEFAIMRAGGVSEAVQYHSTVAAIIARLQNGTTRGNPILLRQWEDADAALNEVMYSLNRLNTLELATNSDASTASYLRDSVNATFDLAGAIDEDHDALRAVKDEVARISIHLDSLREQINNDIQRQSAFLLNERSNLQSLALSISRGELITKPDVTPKPAPAKAPEARILETKISEPVLQNAEVTPVEQRPLFATDNDSFRISEPTDLPISSSPAYSLDPVSASAANAGAKKEQINLGHLLVRIRFDQPNVIYGPQLNEAVENALQKMPDSDFFVLSMYPSLGDADLVAENQRTAKMYADEVRRALIQSGLNPARINLISTGSGTISVPEVLVYIKSAQ
ncbi:MAG: hypothetical protein FWF23_00755 [Alphaproteobacteria bacterium]|nr:hypothetical protein [Alphaproteobacteria bacterium]MCL2505111.1 hypothetical protein [Alphaproteobacteria bacterium]